MVSYTATAARWLGIQNKRRNDVQTARKGGVTGVYCLACGIVASSIGGDYKMYYTGHPDTCI